MKIYLIVYILLALLHWTHNQFYHAMTKCIGTKKKRKKNKCTQ